MKFRDLLLAVAVLGASCESRSERVDPTYPIAGGCGDVFAFAGTADQLEFVAVWLDRGRFDVMDPKAFHDLSKFDSPQDERSIAVWLDRYSAPLDEPYCTDVVPPPGIAHRVSRWKAQRGRLRVVALDPLPELHSGNKYRVRVRIEGVEFVDERGQVVARREAVEFESTVGWMAG